MAKLNKKLWFLLPLIIFMIFVVMLYFRLGKDTTIQTNQTLNRPFPNFSLPSLSDTTQTLNQQHLPKQPYLVNVWASWCYTCRVEHPFLLQMAQQNIPLVGLNYKDELTEALSYLNQHQDPFIMNIQDTQGQLGIDLGLTGVPETFLVDGDGNIRQHIAGEINANRFNQQILPCLTALKNGANEKQIQEACQ